MMRSLLAISCLVAVGLAGCGKPGTEPSQTDPPAKAKPCPDINNRDRNDPCSPLYFKKKGSSLPDKNSL